MTLPSVVVPQKKEMEPPNQNASQIARIHINITIFRGMPANRRERRAPHAEVNNVISAIDRLLQTLQLPAGTLPTEQVTMFVKNTCYYTQINSANPAAFV